MFTKLGLLKTLGFVSKKFKILYYEKLISILEEKESELNSANGDLTSSIESLYDCLLRSLEVPLCNEMQIMSEVYLDVSSISSKASNDLLNGILRRRTVQFDSYFTTSIGPKPFIEWFSSKDSVEEYSEKFLSVLKIHIDLYSENIVVNNLTNALRTLERNVYLNDFIDSIQFRLSFTDFLEISKARIEMGIRVLDNAKQREKTGSR